MWGGSENADTQFSFCQPLQTRLDSGLRAPVVFADAFGAPINNIEVSQAVRPFALSQWTLRQHADTSLTLRYRGEGADETALRRALEGLFGQLSVLRIERAQVLEKVRQYTRQ